MVGYRRRPHAPKGSSVSSTATVGQLIGLNKSFTPSGMRRTFNDLMRLAKVEAIVTK